MENLSWQAVSHPPKENGHYLCYDENISGKNKMDVFRFDKFNSSWYWGSDCFHPQFWMPLPKSPFDPSIMGWYEYDLEAGTTTYTPNPNFNKADEVV